LGCLWQGEKRIVLSLGGQIIHLPKSPSEQPSNIIKGHIKSIESMAYDPQTKFLYSASYDGILIRWNVATGEATDFKGKGHKNTIKQVGIQGKSLVTASLDDTLRLTPTDSLTYGDSISLGAPPVGVAPAHNTPGFLVTATNQSLILIKNGAVATSKDIPTVGPQAVAISPNDQLVAVGGENMNVHLYSIAGGNITEQGVLKAHRGPITRVDFSPDGKYLVSADRNREVIVWDVATKEVKQNQWVFHTARIDALAFSPDSKRIASAGLDQTIIIWSLENPTNRVTIKGAHQGGITEVVWLDDKTIASAGQDCTIRSWNV